MGKALKTGDRGPDVKDLQKALNDAGMKLKVDGQFGPATDEAVKAFQKKNKLKPDGIAGKDTMQKLSTGGESKGGSSAGGDAKSGEDNIKGGKDILKSVDAGLQKKIIEFAGKFGPITITSGKRTLLKQAELMAVMSDKDLGMYGKDNYVAEIKALDKKERTPKKVEEILAKWVKKGSFVSRHLQGRAIDISAQGGFKWSSAEKIAKEVGLKVKQEEGRDCFHVQL
jgi:putative peptidoglycan binding protein